MMKLPLTKRKNYSPLKPVTKTKHRNAAKMKKEINHEENIKRK